MFGEDIPDHTAVQTQVSPLPNTEVRSGEGVLSLLL